MKKQIILTLLLISTNFIMSNSYDDKIEELNNKIIEESIQATSWKPGNISKASIFFGCLSMIYYSLQDCRLNLEINYKELSLVHTISNIYEIQELQKKFRIACLLTCTILGIREICATKYNIHNAKKEAYEKKLAAIVASKQAL